MSDTSPASPSSKPRVNVGFIGHHGHGKTTLVAALLARLARTAGCEATPWSVAELDRVGHPQWHDHDHVGAFTLLPRKLSCASGQRQLGIVDCPGARRRIKHAAWGVHFADVAVLVVAAPDGVQAQTREHLHLALAAGARPCVVVLNKCDLAEDEELIDVLELEVRDLLESCGVDGDAVPIVRTAAGPALAGDALWDSGVGALLETLEHDIALPERVRDEPLLLPIDRVHAYRAAAGHVIVVGTIQRGRVSPGDRLVRVGLGDSRVVLVRQIEIDRTRVDGGAVGQQVGLLLAPGDSLAGGRLVAHDVRRGQALVGAPRISDHTRLRARVRLLRAEEGGRHTPLFNGHVPQFLIGNAAVPGRIALIDTRGMIAPGGQAVVDVQLAQSLHLEVGQRFTFRDGCDGFRHEHGGPQVWGGTVGSGTILHVGRPLDERDRERPID